MENVQLVLDKLHRRSLFHANISSSDVERGKPDPEVFQLAGKKLRVRPRSCVVIEDAAVGIAAANAAEMTSVALVSTGHREDEYGDANYVVQTLSELTPDLLRQWILERDE